MRRVGTKSNPSDIFTKPVSGETFRRLRPALGLQLVPAAGSDEEPAKHTEEAKDRKKEALQSSWCAALRSRRGLNTYSALVASMSLSPVPARAAETSKDNDEMKADAGKNSILIFLVGAWLAWGFACFLLGLCARRGRATGAATPAETGAATPAATRTISTQSPVTYTALRGAAQPSFQLTSSECQGAFASPRETTARRRSGEARSERLAGGNLREQVLAQSIVSSASTAGNERAKECA